MFHDYYKILEIPFTATLDEIKRAYRAKAKIYHPDINNADDANQLFSLINEAYKVLTNEEKRSRFDLKYKYQKRQRYQTQPDYTSINNSKTKKQEFHYDWNSYNQPRPKEKDMRETHPVLFHLLFLFGMFIGFLLSIISIVGTYLKLWPFIFVVTVIPGIILIVEGFNGIMGKSTPYDKLFIWISKRFKNN